MGLSRTPITPDDALHYVIEAFKAAFTLDDRHCWPTVDPMMPLAAIPPGGEVWITVSFGDIEFGFDEADPDALLAQTVATVTAYTRFALDDMGHDDGLLLDATRGAYPLLRQLVAAIHGQELLTDAGQPWCASLPRCVFAAKPDYNQEHMIGWVSARFQISWDWADG
jgi:hypothetical protein